jgi:hypothetical protein
MVTKATHVCDGTVTLFVPNSKSTPLIPTYVYVQKWHSGVTRVEVNIVEAGVCVRTEMVQWCDNSVLIVTRALHKCHKSVTHMSPKCNSFGT